MSKIDSIAKNHIKKLVPYQSARRIGGKGKIWLNANESPYSSIYIKNFSNLNRYPDFQPDDLLSVYSKYSKFSKKNILITRGADEGIDLLIRAFCKEKKHSIITFPPTYGMYAISATISGIQNKKIFIPLGKQLNIEKIKRNLSSVKIIFLCRPNNPTGDLINIETILLILNLTKKKILVVIDEAYIDYNIKYNLTHLIKDFSNLVILRTLSKAFGLAALRCGFVLANSKIINLLSNVIAPYPIPKPTIEIACSFFSSKKLRLLKNNISKINKRKFWLKKKLKNLKFIQKIFISYANFLLIKVKNVKTIFSTLKNYGIILRNQNNTLMLRGCLRISIGTHKECTELLKTLIKIQKMSLF